jgi:hypothetical protein
MSQFDNDFWDKEEEEPSDTWKQSKQYSQKEEQEEEQDGDEELYDLSESEEIEDFLDVEEISVVDNARIRLEQGRLYEMLIKHNLFDGVEAMPQAVTKVQSEIKEFIIERLEILLGMKSEKQKEVHQIIKESQFNELEVQALKMIASKVTKGVSESAPPPSERPKSGLNAIKTSSPSKPALSVVKKSPPPPPPQVQKKTYKQVPVKNPLKQESFKKPVEEDTRNMSPDAIAKKDIRYINSLKDMSLSEANKLVSERHVRPRPTTKMDQESINRHYAAKMAVNQEAQTFTALLAMAKRK